MTYTWRMSWHPSSKTTSFRKSYTHFEYVSQKIWLYSFDWYNQNEYDMSRFFFRPWKHDFDLLLTHVIILFFKKILKTFLWPHTHSEYISRNFFVSSLDWYVQNDYAASGKKSSSTCMSSYHAPTYPKKKTFHHQTVDLNS